ncbi:polysaccharide biosynthesis protein [Paucisalibacillus sp. EB02]|uniref:putative polysaccharide biosynthesis protein n=1 Tax=Paucisalibacillus sp. EB02 TaxID=1347087 RepID=UPI0004B1BE27|nr:polysaccharide biosynthesis protein [Paucisalibacillus sp. EB02]
MEHNKFVKGALILTLAGLISKVLSAGYRIPLQNLTGDLGFYIYQQVYPILGIALVLALYGFPTAISKLAAERKDISVKYFMVPILTILFGICGTLALFLFVNADSIAVFVGDKRLNSAYKLASILLLVIPFSALLRGVFQGKGEMKPTAYSQIGEQFFRVIIIIVMAVCVAKYGIDIYQIGTLAGIATMIGVFAAIFILTMFYLKYKPTTITSHPVPWKYYGKTIFLFGLIASLNHMLLLIIQFADAFTIVPGLVDYGLSNQEAMEAKGVFDRGQPLIQIGAVLGSSFGLALIPSMARDALERKQQHIVSSLKISFYLAWGATVGLILLFPEANRLLYQDNQGDQALTLLMAAILLSSLVITSSSILQGLGHIKWTAFFILGAFSLKWLLNWVLVPQLGIIGSSIGTIVSLLFLTIATLLKLKIGLQIKKLVYINWKAFIFANIGMITFLLIVDKVVQADTFSRVELLFLILIVSTIGALIYLLILIRFKAFSDKELSLLPFVSRFLSNRRSTK